MSSLRHHAAKIIICHNHPSGNPDPSDEDIATTKRIIDAGKILHIPLIDHIIVTEKNVTVSRKDILQENREWTQIILL